MPFSLPAQPLKVVAAIRLADPVVEDVGVPAASVVTAEFPGEVPKAERVRLELGSAPLDAATGRAVADAADAALPEKGLLLVSSHAPFAPQAIASFRNALWPRFHVFRAWRLEAHRKAVRVDASGEKRLDDRFPSSWKGAVVAARRRSAALSPAATAAKFDTNAAGWSGDPGSPVYAHHRWMRRLVAELAADGGSLAGVRALDAGCGAGWVGIEAAKLGASVAAFDPSAEMLKLVEANAKAEGVGVEAKVGFVEQPPFAERFRLVLNSGVISFAPDAERYLAALDALVAPGGRLVIGDANPRSKGFARRRSERAVLPIRELNASTRDDVEARLARLGYRITARRYYQLTSPVPELMHYSARKLGGLGCGWLLARNRKAASRDSDDAERFDSWLLRAEKPA